MDRGDDGRTDNYRHQDRINELTDKISDRLETVGLELVKGVTLLSSGALIAMLGFAQALVKTDGWGAYKIYALVALLHFLIGAIAGPVSLACRTQSLFYQLNIQPDRAKWWFKAMYVPIGVSMGALLLGAAWAGWGIAVAF
jgi:hypothetical protein